MRVEGDAAYDNLSSDDEWADFRAVVAIHNALVMLLGRHEALADMFSAALAARAPVQDESGTPSEAHAATTDIPLAFMLAAAQQGRLRSATPANDSKGPHKTSASDALEKSAFAETALPSSRQALVEAAGSSQALVFDCLFRRVGKHLDTLSSMDCWGLASGGVTSPFDLDLPQFSLSPLAYITRIGELLLALPLHLDTFSGEPSLQFSLETLPNLVSTDAVVASHAGDAGLDTGSQASGDEDERDVTHLWISAVSRAVEAKYVDCILRIPRLTPYGCKQLATDISYLSNVLAAMEIDLEPRLAEVQLRVEQTDAELAGVVEAPAESGSAGAAEAGRDVLAQVAQRIAEQRGLKDAASRGVASSR
ncbi:oligomeric Golgi complex subunit 7 [Entophlyctis helioformis]|nr:oligomeric Golgi complex subunit 7 [Entophlyctis helioformis]